MNSNYTAKKKQKVDSEECNKIFIIHFSSSNEKNFVNLSQAADKEKKIKNVKQIEFKRLKQPGESFYKLSNLCANIPTTLISHHEYHRNAISVLLKFR